MQSNNPILVLDEVDKLGADFRGDPASALLEVLDPEQNVNFKDHYLNMNFDLSKVMFIATANLLENIPYALRDRMEIISLSGYTPQEKIEITKKYILNKEMNNNGIQSEHISFTEKGIKHLISYYTKEAGLRNLSREVGSLCRKVAKQVVMGEDKKCFITAEKIKELLGPAKYLKEDQLKESKIGVGTGLAWTQVGGGDFVCRGYSCASDHKQRYYSYRAVRESDGGVGPSRLFLYSYVCRKSRCSHTVV